MISSIFEKNDLDQIFVSKKKCRDLDDNINLKLLENIFTNIINNKIKNLFDQKNYKIIKNINILKSKKDKNILQTKIEFTINDKIIYIEEFDLLCSTINYNLLNKKRSLLGIGNKNEHNIFKLNSKVQIKNK